MPHPKDDELIPINTVVRFLRGIHNGKKARIKDYTFQHNKQGFLNYLGFIQGKGRDLYVMYHDDIEIVNELKDRKNES